MTKNKNFKSILFRLDPHLYEKIRKDAFNNHVSMAEVIRKILENSYKNRKKDIDI